MSDDKKSDLYNRLSRLFEENKLNIPDVVMSPRWRNEMQRKSYFVGVDPANEDSDTIILGMNVIISPHVEEGTAYLVSRSRNFGYGNQSPLSDELRKEMHATFEQHIVKMIYDTTHTVWQKEVSYNWHQFPDETIFQWGDRLFAKGLLDNPDIRWEYQKAVLGAPFNKLKAMWVKVRS